jgi:hypothetical protein
MTAYSFQKRFVSHVQAGLEPGTWLPGMKRHTMRLPRKGKPGHARIDGPMELYTGMRTKHCRLIGRGRCIAKIGVQLVWQGGALRLRPVNSNCSDAVFDLAPPILVTLLGASLEGPAMDEFARADGFADAADLARFWQVPDDEYGVYLDAVILAWAPVSR